MARPVKIAAQAVAVALVAGLLALLVWKVAHNNSTHLGSQLQAGKPTIALSKDGNALMVGQRSGAKNGSGSGGQ